jgi:broad specificity phosphatase PhoE
MATIYLVRHGKAAAGFDGHLDPGLDELGRQQAEAVAADLANLPPMPIYSSPLARARETAEPLARRWQQDILTEPRVAEIPSPTPDLTARTSWLREVMAGRWSDLGPELQQWRQDLLDCIGAMAGDCVVFCHYIAINVVVGAAQEDDQVVVFSPDNASVTTIRTVARGLQMVELGRTANTQVN